MIPIETVQVIGGQWMKDSSGEGEFNYDVFDTL
jgi:hypothetical protein